MDKKELENAKQLLESELSEACVTNGLSEAVANSLLSNIMDAFNRFLSSQSKQEEKDIDDEDEILSHKIAELREIIFDRVDETHRLGMIGSPVEVIGNAINLLKEH